MSSVISSIIVRRQLKADLIGKDSYRGVTLTYSWLANQFGHFSLGFVPALVLWSVLRSRAGWAYPAFWSAFIVCVAWTAFETYNFLGPLLLKKQTRSKAAFVSSGERYVFQPAWKNIAFDTFTDLCFFWFGAFTANLFIDGSVTTAIILLIIFIILLYPAKHWFVVKTYIQYARFPIQFRLSQWKGKISDQDKEEVEDFLNATGQGHHLLVYGGRRSGKSPLCVGIGTEMAIRKKTCSYYTAIKLLNLFSLTEKQIKEDEECEAWTWRSASLLIIDDINPGAPVAASCISPIQLMTIIASDDKLTQTNRNDLTRKNVIWVVGEDSEDNSFSFWKTALEGIGVPGEKIKKINLMFR